VRGPLGLLFLWIVSARLKAPYFNWAILPPPPRLPVVPVPVLSVRQGQDHSI